MTKTLAGSVWQRPNASWTLQGIPTWDPDTRRTRRPTIGTFSSEAEAHAAQVAYTANLNAGSFSLADSDLSRMPIGEYLRRWKETLRDERDTGLIAERTFMDYCSITDLHLIPHLSTVTIGELSPSVIRRWLLAVRSNGLSERTVEKVYRTLHRAIGDSGLSSNPVTLPKRHRPAGRPTQERNYPDMATVRRFINHISMCDQVTGFRAPLTLAAFTGLRRAEICGLSWDDLDLDEGTLAVNRSLQVRKTDRVEFKYGEMTELFVKPPKSQFGYRKIGIPSTVVQMLRQYRSTTAEHRLHAGSQFQQCPLNHDFVFRSDHRGKPLHPDRLTNVMTSEWNHANLSPRTTLHGLRHAVGSALILGGMNITDVAAHLGDKPKTVQLFYQHELDSPARRARINDTIHQMLG